MPLEIPFFVQELVVLAILAFLFFHMKLSIILLKSVKNCAADFDGDCIEAVDCFW